jgi:hypothetical protein
VAGARSNDTHGRHGESTRVQPWEPVVRQVALELSALEDTGTPASSPHLRLETLTRLIGT